MLIWQQGFHTAHKHIHHPVDFYRLQFEKEREAALARGEQLDVRMGDGDKCKLFRGCSHRREMVTKHFSFIPECMCRLRPLSSSEMILTNVCAMCYVICAMLYIYLSLHVSLSLSVCVCVSLSLFNHTQTLTHKFFYIPLIFFFISCLLLPIFNEQWLSN